MATKRTLHPDLRQRIRAAYAEIDAMLHYPTELRQQLAEAVSRYGKVTIAIDERRSDRVSIRIDGTEVARAPSLEQASAKFLKEREPDADWSPRPIPEASKKRLKRLVRQHEIEQWNGTRKGRQP